VETGPFHQYGEQVLNNLLPKNVNVFVKWEEKGGGGAIWAQQEE
jgi:hypothetical protein